MDQWAACSVNLLFSQPAVLIDLVPEWEKNGKRRPEAFVVSNANTADNYERFCRAIDELARRLEMQTDDIDRVMIGKIKRQSTPWRNHVRQHRRPFYG